MPSIWKPVKQSPVHHQLTKCGAVLSEVSGWLLPEHFGDTQEEALAVGSSVGLADLSSVPKWEIKGSDVSRFVMSVFGVETLDPGYASRVSLGTLSRVSRHHALLVMDQAEAHAPGQIGDESSFTGCVHITDRTSGLGNLVLCGPRAADVLGKVSSLDLRELVFPHLRCASGPVAAIQTLVVRRDRKTIPAYEILFSREYGEYLWLAISAAGEEFHLRPFGLAAARMLEQ